MSVVAAQFCLCKNSKNCLCRWIRAPTDACFVQSVKPGKLDKLEELLGESVHRSHVMALVFEYVQLPVRLINVWEHMTSKVTITLPLINSNKDFDFVGWVIKTPCLFYFLSVKFHYMTETHDINSLLTLMKIVLASQNKKQPNKSLSRFVHNWKCARLTMQMSYSYASVWPFKNFCKLAKQAEAIRNSAKGFGYD